MCLVKFLWYDSNGLIHESNYIDSKDPFLMQWVSKLLLENINEWYIDPQNNSFFNPKSNNTMSNFASSVFIYERITWAVSVHVIKIQLRWE